MNKGLIVIATFLLSTNVYANSASSNSGLAKATSAASIGLNAWMGKIMMKDCPAVAMNCAVAAMSFAQIPMQVQTLVSSGDAEKGVSANISAGDFTAAGGAGYNDSAGVSQQQIDQFKADAEKGLADLEKKGYKVNRKTGAVTGPNGKTASGAAFSSGEALADSGLIPEDQIDAYNDTLKNYKKKKDKIIVKSLGGAKGGYRGPKKRRSASINFDNYNGYGSGIDKSKIRAAQTSGLAKDFGGTPIGVASDDLFNMVSQRYGAMKDKRQFIDNAAGTYQGQR